MRPRALHMGIVLVLAGCGTQAVTDGAPARVGIPARSFEGRTLTIRLPMVLDHRNPSPVATKRSWIPIAAAPPAGSELEAGGVVASFDATVAIDWKATEERSQAERGASAEGERLRGSGRIDQLRRRREDLTVRLAVIDAEIAATRRKDEDQIRIARLEVEQVRTRAARATDELRRMRDLAAQGAAAATELARAENEAALSVAEVRAPELRLEILETTTLAVTRYRKTLERAVTADDLHGVEAELAALESGEKRAGTIQAWEVARGERSLAELQSVIEDPTVRTDVGGVLRPRDDDFGIGQKPGSAPFAWVLPDQGLVGIVEVPDRWLALLPANGGVATLHLAGLNRPLAARVSGVAAAPHEREDGTGRSVRVQLEPIDQDPALRPGLAGEAILQLDAGAVPVATVPAWCLADHRRPRVTMIDGTVRELEGLFLGHEFVVLAGLQPGERVQVSEVPALGTMRLAATVEPAESRPISIYSSHRHWETWELIWCLPDGAEVVAGDVVAKLAFSRGDLPDRAFELEYAELKAAADLARAQADAEATLERAATSWRAAATEVDRVRFELMVLLAEAEDPAVEERQAAVVKAETELRTARRRAEELAIPGAAAAFSQRDIEQRRRAVVQAEASLLRAQLDACSIRRSLSWIDLRNAEEAVRDADASLANTRDAYARERLAVQARLSRAQFDYRQELEHRSSDRSRVEGAELKAPVAGRVFQRPRRDGRPLRLGDTIEVDEPFLIPVGDRRRFTVEVPARFYGRFVVGQKVAFVAPALGTGEREGTVVAVGAWFGDPQSVKGERMLGGTLGADERVFQVRVEFTLDEAERERLPLGSGVFLDV